MVMDIAGKCLLAGAVLGLGACAATVTPVVAVPGPGRQVAGFQEDEGKCRRAASESAYGKAEPTANSSNAQWQRYFASLARCVETHGDRVMPVPWTWAYAAYLGAPTAYPPVYAYPVPYGYPPPYPVFPGY